MFGNGLIELFCGEGLDRHGESPEVGGTRLNDLTCQHGGKATLRQDQCKALSLPLASFIAAVAPRHRVLTQARPLHSATSLKITRDNLETAMPSRPNPYREHLDPNPANYAVLTPIDFLDWAAEAYPDRLALIHGDCRQSWAVVQKLCQQMAAGIQAQQLGVGDTVAVMLPNIPAMIYAHFAVPMTGAVLNCINTRLDPATVAYILEHSESKLFFYDAEYEAVVLSALELLNEKAKHPLPRCVRVLDPVYVQEQEALGQPLKLKALNQDRAEQGSRSHGARSHAQPSIEDFDAWLAKPCAQPFVYCPPELETDAIGLNYTSGTTGHPKGVVVHHRGAYLNALSNVLALPGISDITCHINFSNLLHSIENEENAQSFFSSQASYLLDAGITDLVLQQSDPRDPQQMIAISNGIQKLISEAEMGELFKVLAFGKHLEGLDLDLYALPGFRCRNRVY
ncbi:MAG: hypothetical protein EBY70_00805 [Burkholderiaceae bacterium]|nr:hypothetical protein [Burkholderiaceae bacterium]